MANFSVAADTGWNSTPFDRTACAISMRQQRSNAEK
jgi:hypothetical protein